MECDENCWLKNHQKVGLSAASCPTTRGVKNYKSLHLIAIQCRAQAAPPLTQCSRSDLTQIDSVVTLMNRSNQYIVNIRVLRPHLSASMPFARFMSNRSEFSKACAAMIILCTYKYREGPLW